jgi:hypothetical protein
VKNEIGMDRHSCALAQNRHDLHPMKTRRWTSFFLSLLLVLVALVLFLVAAWTGFNYRISQSLADAQQRLIDQPNHPAILQACRQVLKDPQAAGFPKGVDSIGGSQNGMPPPPAALPAVLANLNFEMMILRDHHAEIWFGGGFGHWGYSTASIASEEVKDFQLIPGLWFWSEYRFPKDLPTTSFLCATIALVSGGIAALIAAVVVPVRAFGRTASA